MIWVGFLVIILGIPLACYLATLAMEEERRGDKLSSNVTAIAMLIVIVGIFLPLFVIIGKGE